MTKYIHKLIINSNKLIPDLLPDSTHNTINNANYNTPNINNKLVLINDYELIK